MFLNETNAEVQMKCENADHERFRGVFHAKNGCLACQCEELSKNLTEASARWQLYEREYILPTFDWAAELGIDLQALVRQKAGKNCVRLLVEELAKQLGKRLYGQD